MKQKELARLKLGYDAVVTIGQPVVLPLAGEPHSTAAATQRVDSPVQSVGRLTPDRLDD